MMMTVMENIHTDRHSWCLALGWETTVLEFELFFHDILCCKFNLINLFYGSALKYLLFCPNTP